MRQGLLVIAVGVVLLAELEAEVQVVRIALDALGEVVEDELVLLALHVDGLLLAAFRAQGLDLLVVVLHLRLREHAVELRIHRAGRRDRLLEDVDRLVVALALDVDAGERAAGVHVLRLRLDLLELLLDQDLGVVARDDRLVRGVELRGLLLVRDQVLEAALLADGLLPALVHRRARLGVLQQLQDALVAGLQFGKLLVGVARLVPALRHRVVRRHALQEGRVPVRALVRRLDRDRRVVGLAGRLRRLDGRLDVVRVERILREELLRLGHRLGGLPLLDEAGDLLPRHQVAELRAEAGLAVLAEVRDLRRAQELARLQHVRRGRDRLHQHVHRELVAARLQRLPPAIREVLRLLGKIDRHHDTSSRESSSLPSTPPAL